MFGSIFAASIAAFTIVSMTSLSFDTTKIRVESQSVQATFSVAVPAYSLKNDVAMCQYATARYVPCELSFHYVRRML